MFGTKNNSSLVKAAILMAIGGCLAKWGMDARRTEVVVSARSQSVGRGDYGGDLKFLRGRVAGPKAAGESNHYIDLWKGDSLQAMARANGLTNNHALFVDSHAKGGVSWRGGYGVYPHETLLAQGQPTPYYSPRDLATVLGSSNAAGVHNILIAGCNEDRRFRSEEFRRHFVNATNITYMSPGKLAFKPMFYQAIVLPSSEIKPLYGKLRQTTNGRMKTNVSTVPLPGTEELGAFVADLYLPDARVPYCTRRAGRELIDPQPFSVPASGDHASLR